MNTKKSKVAPKKAVKKTPVKKAAAKKPVSNVTPVKTLSPRERLVELKAQQKAIRVEAKALKDASKAESKASGEARKHLAESKSEFKKDWADLRDAVAKVRKGMKNKDLTAQQLQDIIGNTANMIDPFKNSLFNLKDDVLASSKK